MGLSCSCEFDIEAGSWFWQDSSRLKPMEARKRRVKCCACKGLINEGDNVVEFYRFMALHEDSIEYRIHGESRPIASFFECEECTELREAIEELGYCVNLGDHMQSLIQEINDSK